MTAKQIAVLLALRNNEKPPTLANSVVAPLMAAALTYVIELKPSHSYKTIGLTSSGRVFVEFQIREKRKGWLEAKRG